jgi:hypothetical protein
MALFNWGNLSQEQLMAQRQLEEEAFIEEAMRQRINRPMSSDVEFDVPSAGESGDGGDGGGVGGGVVITES